MTTAAEIENCFQLKGGLFTLPTLRLHTLDYAALSSALDDKIQQAPNFFRHAPVVLDVHRLGQVEDLINFSQLAKTIKEKGLIVVGVRGGSAKLQLLAKEAGLAILPESKEKSEPSVSKTTPSSDHSVSQQSPSSLASDDSGSLNQTKVITHPVRSGQQIYSSGGDLIVLASVSHGAELLADGHIHVYGALRGRALAGVNGDKSAIIYCQSLEAELISIAGRYRMSDDLKETVWKVPTMIQLKSDKLSLNPL